MSFKYCLYIVNTSFLFEGFNIDNLENQESYHFENLDKKGQNHNEKLFTNEESIEKRW